MSQFTDPTHQFRLADKVALVTAGSRGLGKEMILAFARCGVDVVIASRKKEACWSLAKEVENETGRRAFTADLGRDPVRRRQVGTAQSHPEPGPGLRARGPRQLHHAGCLPDAHRQGVAQGNARRDGTARALEARRQPDEIVGAALFLASNASRYATGSVLKIDGGAAYGMG